MPDAVLAAVPRGERLLAFAQARDGSWLLGTRRFLAVLQDGRRRLVPWEAVEDAAWDTEGERLRITEVGEFGRPKPSYAFDMDQPALLLQLVRERVTASIVLQRRIPVRDGKGFRLIARRSPVGGEVSWFLDYDPGIDPDDATTRQIAEAALLEGRAEAGVDHAEDPG